MDYGGPSFSTLGQSANHIFHNAKKQLADVDNITGDSVASSLLSMHKLCIEIRFRGVQQHFQAPWRHSVGLRPLPPDPFAEAAELSRWAVVRSGAVAARTVFPQRSRGRAPLPSESHGPLPA